MTPVLFIKFTSTCYYQKNKRNKLKKKWVKEIAFVQLAYQQTKKWLFYVANSITRPPKSHQHHQIWQITKTRPGPPLSQPQPHLPPSLLCRPITPRIPLRFAVKTLTQNTWTWDLKPTLDVWFLRSALEGGAKAEFGGEDLQGMDRVWGNGHDRDLRVWQPWKKKMQGIWGLFMTLEQPLKQFLTWTWLSVFVRFALEGNRERGGLHSYVASLTS